MEDSGLLFSRVDNLVIGLAILAIAALTGLFVKYILFRLLDLYNKRESPHLTLSITRHLSSAFTVFLPLLFASFALPTTPFDERQLYTFRRVFELVNIAVFGWILVKVTYVAQDMVQLKYHIEKPDNIRERRLFTQLQFIKRLTIIMIIFITISLILLSFESVKRLGTGMLTSAGIAGIIVGFAAQRSLANLLAGLQIAFSQPIRIDDVLVVENEFGRVEEITLTHVVLRLWDQRRMILPLNYFIEKPFQNWTHTGSDILATVYLYTDYTIPVDELRQELDRILATTNLWNRKVAGLQVTDAKENTVQLRALVSADGSGEAWDLRCLVREKLITYIQQKYPQSLPRLRTELVGEAIQLLGRQQV
ncbi:mechanosensitive ion channel family protein [Pontibacter ruber]|uniref:Mechanosensitive ion channel family protein n=1 Tax=Pontibacter ruber TaxID=1343895 RepID=A0ABW5CZ53_9BACT|nr:mechanosensitive ion channel domain-containing protein [Pontibacter ruber]